MIENCISGGGTKCKYSFILMDLHMPVMDGEQSASLMREMVRQGTLDLSGTKIIALSAINGDQYEEISKKNLFD